MADGFNTEDMLDIYLLENQQLLEQLQEIVLEQKDKDYFDEDAIHKIFRTMHTIKGSSCFMMFDTISEAAHKLEDIFEVLRESYPENVPHLQLVEYVLEVADFITAELGKIQNGESVDGDSRVLIAKLDAFLDKLKKETSVYKKQKTSKKEVTAQKFYIAPVERNSSKTSIFIDLESSVEEIEDRVRRTQEQIIAESKTKVLVPGDFVIEPKEIGRAKKAEKAAYINVDVKKMDQLMNLMEELVISQSQVLQNLDDYHPSVEEMTRITTDLQNVIQSMRMVSLVSTFQKMNRIVFDVSRKLEKDVDFVMEGEHLEVDRNRIEYISDSIMHLIRNAIDHGIETPVERVKAGKTERAKIILSARMEADEMWIIVEDNGKGLDRQQIMDKARRKGLLDYSKPENEYTDKEVYQFITLPGFSTMEKVTEYSGRGVGMDVVVSNIASIGGNLEIESVKGKGSKMILKIPMEKVWKTLR